MRAAQRRILFRVGASRAQVGSHARRRFASQSQHDVGADEPKENLGFEVDGDTKTVRTSGGTLPLSPLMDPSFHKARVKFSHPKVPESAHHAKSKFRRQLERNSYAQALATPARRCDATGTVLPRYFLQDFMLVKHPETGRPWWVSPSLAPDQPQRPSTADENANKPESDAAASSPSPATQAGNKKPTGPTGYLVSRRALLKEFQGTSRHVYSNAHRRRLLRSSSSSDSLHRAVSSSVWRDDMDSFLLELMRRRVVEGLLYFSELCEQGRKYLVRCEDWRYIENHQHRGCVLWLSEPSLTTGGGDIVQDAESGPGQLATMDTKGNRRDVKLAVHNLRYLLGDEHLGDLRQKSALLGLGGIFLLCRKRSTALQLQLWKLQGYIAEF